MEKTYTLVVFGNRETEPVLTRKDARIKNIVASENRMEFLMPNNSEVILLNCTNVVLMGGAER